MEPRIPSTERCAASDVIQMQQADRRAVLWSPDRARSAAGASSAALIMPAQSGADVMTDGERHKAERTSALHALDELLQTPMVVLSFIWLAVVIAGLIWSDAGIIGIFGTAIWVLFLLEFALRLALAPEKLRFLRTNWLTLIALAVPAARMVRVVPALRAASALRGARLVQIVTSLNRGMIAMRRTMKRRGIGYVALLTIAVIFLGAAGMLAFEPYAGQGQGFSSYGDALWWTAMLVASLGTSYWPESPEGRILCLLIAVYGLGVFGYITATIATVFIGVDREPD
jgi:voltage-gated potassium channel